MPNTPKLLPCPFCGGEPFEHHYPAHTHKVATWLPDATDQYAVECVDCGVGHLCETSEAAAIWWNTRPISLPIKELVTALSRAHRALHLLAYDDANSVDATAKTAMDQISEVLQKYTHLYTKEL